MVDIQIPMLCVRWKTNTRVHSWNGICSSEFRFQGGKCFLRFCSWNSKNNLELITASDGCLGPFGLEVHVESGRTGRILPELTRRTRFERESCFSIWRLSDDQIISADPEFSRNYDLRLLVMLKADDVLTDYGSTCPLCSISLDSASSLKSLSEDFSKLLLDQGSDPDVEFRCGDHSTKAHRAIVSARSRVMATMLHSDMVEGKTGVVEIPDMEPEVFERFLRYLYTGESEELTFDVALRLYEAGDQYEVQELTKRCAKFLIANLTVQNACEVLVVADAHSDEETVDAVVIYILQQKVPLESDLWSPFCADHAALAMKVLDYYYKSSLN